MENILVQTKTVLRLVSITSILHSTIKKWSLPHRSLSELKDKAGSYILQQGSRMINTYSRSADGNWSHVSLSRFIQFILSAPLSSTSGRFSIVSDSIATLFAISNPAPTYPLVMRTQTLLNTDTPPPYNVHLGTVAWRDLEQRISGSSSGKASLNGYTPSPHPYHVHSRTVGQRNVELWKSWPSSWTSFPSTHRESKTCLYQLRSCQFHRTPLGIHSSSSGRALTIGSHLSNPSGKREWSLIQLRIGQKHLTQTFLLIYSWCHSVCP